MASQLSITPTDTNQLKLICAHDTFVSKPFNSRDELFKAIEPDNLLRTIENSFPDFEMPIDVWGVTVGDKWYAMEELAPGAFDEVL